VRNAKCLSVAAFLLRTPTECVVETVLVSLTIPVNAKRGTMVLNVSRTNVMELFLITRTSCVRGMERVWLRILVIVNLVILVYNAKVILVTMLFTTSPVFVRPMVPV